MRKLLLLIFLLSAALGQQAYSQITIHPVVFSSKEYDNVLDACQDAQGNLYVLASSWIHPPDQGSIRDPGKQRGTFGNGPFVMVYNAAGELVKTAGVGFVGNYLKSIAVDQAGNIYLTGSKSQYTLVIAKLDKNFKQQWAITEGTQGGFVGNKVQVDGAGNVYVAGVINGTHIFGLQLRNGICCPENDFLVKVNAAGKFQWVKAGENATSAAISMTMDQAGNIILVGRTEWGATYGSSRVGRGLLVVKYTPDGNALWAKSYGYSENIYRNQEGYATASDVTVDEFNNIYVAGSMLGKPKFGNYSLTIAPNTSDAMLLKLLPDGQVAWVKAGAYPTLGNQYSSISYRDNHIQVAGCANESGFFSNSLVTAAGYDTHGKQLWKMNLPEKTSGQATKILALPGRKSFLFGQFWNSLVVGNHTFPTAGREDAFQVQLLDASRNHSSCTLEGTLYRDADGNCQAGANETGLAGIVVQALPGPYYGITDSQGHYAIATDTGSYTVHALLPQQNGRTFTQVCAPLQGLIRLPAPGTIVSNLDLGYHITDKPYLEVSIASDRRRRCFRNITTVSYANNGFAPSAPAKMYVQLPPHLEFIKATLPFTKDSKGNYVFEVGALKPNQGGILSITDSVACGNPAIRGLTVCTEAWITPGNSYLAPAHWNKASIAVSGARTGHRQAKFVIRNTGTGPQTDSLSYRLFQDTDLALQHKFLLGAGDSLVLQVVALRDVLRLEADQPPGHPIATMASSTIEVSEARPGGRARLAMAAFPPAEQEPEKARDCQPILDSYDPNDKQVLPTGITSEFYTPTNTPLRYQVRFQNTGNDVAYRVIVVDTLSADLEVSTLRVGAVSHPYTLAVSGKTRPVLTFTFDRIMLPDSAHDPAGSNGFIQFSIKPKASLPAKTAIENFADIFLDYNDPVRTNLTVNRIYDIPYQVNPTVRLLAREVVVSPAISAVSPAQGKAGTLITLKGNNFATTSSENQVFFNGKVAPVLSASPDALTVKVPAGAISGKIKVITPMGSTQILTDFTVYQPPVITSVNPPEAVPATAISIRGENFSPNMAQDTVLFNGTPAQVLQASATTLQVVVPAGATLGNIQVKTLGGQTESPDAFMVWYPPTLTGFNPGKGKTGTRLTLTGTSFATVPERNTVTFGSIPATVHTASETTLDVQVPGGAESGSITLQTPGGRVSTATGFTFIPASIIASFFPASGSTGDEITLTGKNFQADGQEDSVYFNGVMAKVVSATPTQMVVLVPKKASSGVITIAGAGGRTGSALPFSILDLSPEAAVSVYPNPSPGEITIDWSKADFAMQEINIFNAIGSLILSQQLKANAPEKLTLKLKNKKPGIYLIQLQTSGGAVIKRITLL